MYIKNKFKWIFLLRIELISQQIPQLMVNKNIFVLFQWLSRMKQIWAFASLCRSKNCKNVTF